MDNAFLDAYYQTLERVSREKELAAQREMERSRLAQQHSQFREGLDFSKLERADRVQQQQRAFAFQEAQAKAEAARQGATMQAQGLMRPTKAPEPLQLPMGAFLPTGVTPPEKGTLFGDMELVPTTPQERASTQLEIAKQAADQETAQKIDHTKRIIKEYNIPPLIAQQLMAKVVTGQALAIPGFEEMFVQQGLSRNLPISQIGADYSKFLRSTRSDPASEAYHYATAEASRYNLERIKAVDAAEGLVAQAMASLPGSPTDPGWIPQVIAKAAELGGNKPALFSAIKEAVYGKAALRQPTATRPSALGALGALPSPTKPPPATPPSTPVAPSPEVIKWLEGLR